MPRRRLPQAGNVDASTAGEAGGAGSSGRTWWHWTDSGPDNRPSRAATYSGWDGAFDAIAAALAEHRPDGILGFSQGATAAALYVADASLRRAAAAAAAGTTFEDASGSGSGPAGSAGALPQLPRFAIVVSGFLPRDETFAARLRDARPAVPTLHVLGTQDKLVPEERSRDLAAVFDASTAELFAHGGAHMVPTCSGDFKAAMVAFLDRFRPAGADSSSASGPTNPSTRAPAAAAAAGERLAASVDALSV